MEREFPKVPIAGIGAVVLHQGRVLLVRRANPPMQGRWTLPGGAVELGESLKDCVIREIREETDLLVEPLEIVEVVDRIDRENGRIRFHYIIADFLCSLVSGSLQAGSDASGALWAAPSDFESLNLDPLSRQVIAKAFRLQAARLQDPT